ncbi:MULTISPECIES: alpha-ketoglutarate-dependent dioxygenase AlkB family protein [Robiginitalea]|uniref:Alkylated DNA repair protein n=1 Tax=Robiginitalea biformata (strain ATCC BAA-864 / DSM 15991 / KCTC 12146 / HTCC2501) TaxID=313596 RepID=A4CQ67_ROBBH|nr:MULTISPECIES: alpha-ketoglutarate-dependent dioxygenase AlkB [Robiginitalea]EAR14152.1 alkylated DNA repair protein [Robiginitalea biformata HTCC2501]MDC6354753.1 alpha-ketoglutarate-dependent dioxygenase AlkB [Robiginitalea sp. PM2]MDC6375019.1 alpha-ketoglutarate-dependent dioxygenase AlkB [Robiginitalea sp. SP8]
MNPSREDLENLPDATLRYQPGFLLPKEAESLFGEIKSQTPWRQDTIRLFGKTFQQPRLTALYGKNGQAYTYSGILMEPLPFTPLLEDLLHRVSIAAGEKFTTCLLNLYRDGSDSNGWHADDEPELGNNPVIASLSLGASRKFHLKHRRIKSQRVRMNLESGSLLLMAGTTQHHWLHQVPKTKRPVGPRINLTFRRLG